MPPPASSSALDSPLWTLAFYLQNNFYMEKNPTIVTFPVKNLELREYLNLGEHMGVPTYGKHGQWSYVMSVCINTELPLHCRCITDPVPHSLWRLACSGWAGGTGLLSERRSWRICLLES